MPITSCPKTAGAPLTRRGAFRAVAVAGLVSMAGQWSVPVSSAQTAVAAVLRGSDIRLRQGAGVEFPALLILQGGQAVTRTGRVQVAGRHLWREVMLETGESGWVGWEFLAGGSPAPEPGEIVVEPAAASVVSVEPNPAPAPEPEPAPEAEPAPAEEDRKARKDGAARKRRDEAAEPSSNGGDEPPAPDGAFVSGGLGLSLAEAEEFYGPSVEDALGRAWPLEGGQLILGFEAGEWSTYAERLFDPTVEFAVAADEVIRLAPEDAESLGADERRGQTVERFESPSLAARFGGADVWTDANPGEFIAAYGGYDPASGVETAERVVLRLGNPA